MNASEALPGVCTPLTWSFYGERVELAFRATLHDLGVLPSRLVYLPPDVDDRMWGIFYGRAAANLSNFRAIADLIPGTSANALEAQIFGQVRPEMVNHPSYRRWPIVAVKLPTSAMTLSGRLHRQRATIQAWWESSVFGTDRDDLAVATGRMREACRNFVDVMRPHTLAAMFCQSLYEQIRRLAERASQPELLNVLVRGYGCMDEIAVAADLWAVSRDHLSLAEFTAKHGYHGPREGETASRSWREDPSPLSTLVDGYRSMPDEGDPKGVGQSRAEDREGAEVSLLNGLPRQWQPVGRIVLKAAARYIPLRGTGKASSLQCIDVVRSSARIIGEDLACRHVLDDPDDAFYLTVDELLTEPSPERLQAAASERRGLRAQYELLDLPQRWDGMPTPQSVQSPNAQGADTTLTGIAVSPGVVEGRARVVIDPAAADLQAGEILVCETTDPSWAPLFLLAGALVIDVGGPMSHGAIVARELGVPCVINTRRGTKTIQTGDLLRVDGSQGSVEICPS